MNLVFAALLALTQPWLLVSDLHVIPYSSGDYPSYYRSDTNWALLDSTVEEMRQAVPDARVIVISGDFLAHNFATWSRRGRPNQSVTASALYTMSRIESAFARAFPKAQFVIALGNNDDPCGDYRTSPDSPYLAAVARIWAPLVNRGGAAPDFIRSFSHNASYTARVPANGVRVVAVDDVYWSVLYRPCRATRANQRAAEMSWLANTLARTPRGVRNVILMHIPPGVDPASTLLTHRLLIVPFMSDDMRAHLFSLFSERNDIAFAIAGHMHRNGFRIAGGVPLIVAPAISPVYENNPTFLRLDVDERGVPVDERQYAYSIREGAWSEIFDFDRSYDVTSLKAPQLLAAHRLIGDNSAAREKWAQSMTGGSYFSREILAAWQSFWCAQTAFGSQYVRCAGDQRRAAILPVALALFAALIVLALGALGLRLARQRGTR